VESIASTICVNRSNLIEPRIGWNCLNRSQDHQIGDTLSLRRFDFSSRRPILWVWFRATLRLSRSPSRTLHMRNAFVSTFLIAWGSVVLADQPVPQAPLKGMPVPGPVMAPQKGLPLAQGPIPAPVKGLPVAQGPIAAPAKMIPAPVKWPKVRSPLLSRLSLVPWDKPPLPPSSHSQPSSTDDGFVSLRRIYFETGFPSTVAGSEPAAVDDIVYCIYKPIYRSICVERRFETSQHAQGVLGGALFGVLFGLAPSGRELM